MTILKSHYEKLILAFSVILTLVFILLPFFADTDDITTDVSSSHSSFWFDINEEGSQYLNLSVESDLMPGDQVTFISRNEQTTIHTFEIEKIVLLEGNYYVINNGKEEIEGSLISPNNEKNIIVSRDWKKGKESLAILSDTGRPQSVPVSQSLSIFGERQIIFDQDIEEFDSDNFYISLYQGFSTISGDQNGTRVDRVRWTKSAEEKEDSIYDLFTPPIIYLIDGNLTTELPKKVVQTVEEIEDFGLVLEGFEKKPYRFKMSGWIGEVPIFDDQSPKVTERRQKNRNRMEKGVPYRENINGKAGSSSFIATTTDDENKILMVTHFVVQQIKDDKTGGVRPVGRALVQDYKLGGKPFEINSLMKEVFAGQNEIRMRFRLDGLNEPMVFSDKDIGKVFEFGTRKYLVKEIDLKMKSLVIEKRGPEPKDLRVQKFTQP